MAKLRIKSLSYLMFCISPTTKAVGSAVGAPTTKAVGSYEVKK